jgi:ParB/Sulfiredoxin domain
MPEAHSASALFPMMDNVALAALVRDIKAHGLREPIVLWEGKVLDGRNRLRACELAGVEPRFVELASCASPVEAVVSSNLFRRHLTVSQRAMVGALAKRQLATEARLRQVASRARPGQKVGDWAADDKVVATLPPPGKPGKARDHAAALVGVSGRSIETASQVLRAGSPDVIEAVQAGRMTVSTAAKLVKAPPAVPTDGTRVDNPAARIRLATAEAFLAGVPVETADLLLSRPSFVVRLGAELDGLWRSPGR